MDLWLTNKRVHKVLHSAAGQGNILCYLNPQMIPFSASVCSVALEAGQQAALQLGVCSSSKKRLVLCLPCRASDPVFFLNSESTLLLS